MADDPDLVAAQSGLTTTAAGMRLNGLTDTIEQPPTEEGDIGTVEQRTALVDYLEFYLLNYFKPATERGNIRCRAWPPELFEKAGCATCHIPDLKILRDRRVADVETVFDPENGTLQPPVRYGAVTAQQTRHQSGRKTPRRFPLCSRSSSRTSTPISSATISVRTSTSGTTMARCVRRS